MPIDMNMDLGDLVKSLTGGANKNGANSANKATSPLIQKITPYKNSIVFFVAILILIGSYFGFYYVPMQEENVKKEKEIARLIELQDKTKDLEKKIAKTKSKLNKSREKNLESLAHFGNSEDLGELYRSVSTLAAKYNLDVMQVKEIVPKVKKQKVKKKRKKKKKKGKKDSKEKAKIKKPQIDVKEIVVEVDLKGRYAEYIMFKEDLAIAEMLLKINEEAIKINSDESEAGKIYVSLNLSTYAIDKTKFQSTVEN